MTSHSLAERRKKRSYYTPEVMATVAAKYPICRSTADREMLIAELGIESVGRLYNLASRIGATQQHADRKQSAEDNRVYDPRMDARRLTLRDDPARTSWTPEQDRFLREHFGRAHIEAMAYFLNRTETAAAYRVRQLGLRDIPMYYDAAKVAPWLSLSARQLTELLVPRGLRVYPCTDMRGRLAITLVSTASLARSLARQRVWKRLLDLRGADAFFIKDLFESVSALQRGGASWEFSCWVSHGHTCLNPFSDTCFGLFYTQPDPTWPAKT